MSKRKHTFFDESLMLNNQSYMYYIERLTELSVSMFEWKNLPDTVDPRYIELQLFETGAMVYFRDDVIGDLCLNCLPSGNMNVYGYPILRRAYSRYNNYQVLLKESNSVIIWNNYIRTNSLLTVQMFARKLWRADRIIDVNLNAQKTPVLVQGNEKQRLSLINLYKEFDGNSPVIFGDSYLDMSSLKALKTDAPYIADKVQELKEKIWNEALTYLGISNLSIQKKERLISDEVIRNQGGTIASRYSRLDMRKQAVEDINRMFGTDIEVDYRDLSGDEFESMLTLEGGEEDEQVYDRT